MLRFVALMALATQAFAADLEIRYSALERMVAAQMFTQEGRRYVRGNQAAKCQYAVETGSPSQRSQHSYGAIHMAGPDLPTSIRAIKEIHVRRDRAR